MANATAVVLRRQSFLDTTRAAFTWHPASFKVLLTAGEDSRRATNQQGGFVMRTKFHGVLVTLGLAATVLAKASHAEMLPPTTPGMELVVDAALHPTELHWKFNRQPDSIGDFKDVMASDPGDSTGLNLALASPGLLFGAPHNFLSLFLRFNSPATTGLAFPNLAH
jgi:hypothetical protein